MVTHHMLCVSGILTDFMFLGCVRQSSQKQHVTALHSKINFLSKQHACTLLFIEKTSIQKL